MYKAFYEIIGDKRRQRIFLAVAAVFALAIASFISFKFLPFSNKEHVRATQFGGYAREVKTLSVVIEGVFLENENPVAVSQETKRVEVIIQPDTKIIKKLVYLPTAEKTKKTDGVYYEKDLQQEEVSVDIDALRSDLLEVGALSVVVQASSNIYNSDEFVATTITYKFFARSEKTATE